ncbi:xylitol oxidase [Paraoerskovia marina]|uniref:Xylitol oxidase n=1 Tax=Paraoerskovia marina TaxID=545619 RepID=A0A1H1NM15_9CELL|nr:FAD-binding protein [Paraoerskovia marina]SDR99900.1 xylitol oxidase [Paraoerskovia marina]
MTESRTWARNLAYAAHEVRHPQTLAELSDVVRTAPRVRALGTRHSFNDVADTTGTHVVLDRLDDGRAPVEVDRAAMTASVAAGLRYGEVSLALHAEGVALGAMASLPHISVAGAVATATHGSGDAEANLAAAVAGLEIMTDDGEHRLLGRDHPDLPGAVVSLGALGVVTRVLLDVVPTYAVRQNVYLGLGWDTLAASFDAVTASATSVSLFTRWGDGGVDQVWQKQAVGRSDAPAPEEYLGARAAVSAMHPLPGVDAAACTAQLGVPGPWNERLPHFRLDHTPSNGEELQSEFLLPRRHAVAAIEAMRGLAPVIRPLLQVTEIRTVAADRLWMSTANADAAGADGVVGFHFTWNPAQAEVEAVLPRIERALAPFDARPHWGKVFTEDVRDVVGRYPRFGDFRALAERYDPAGRFRGGYVEAMLG